MIKFLRGFLLFLKNKRRNFIENRRIKLYLCKRDPWSVGYDEYKRKRIKENIKNDDILNNFILQKLPHEYGTGIDERIVEYPWVLSQLSKSSTKILDAGSTLNFDFIVEHPIIKRKQLTIYTFHPEENNFCKNKISYLYGDLREIPFKENYFDEIVCISTIEHIDMDNSIYGWSTENKNENKNGKSYEYMKAISELVRALKNDGLLLLTIPFGKFEKHEFFQQFDKEMVEKITSYLTSHGTFETNYFKYSKNGWNFSSLQKCEEAISYNPHTGTGKGDDGAAHSRAICCIKFNKSK